MSTSPPLPSRRGQTLSLSQEALDKTRWQAAHGMARRMHNCGSDRLYVAFFGDEAARFDPLAVPAAVRSVPLASVPLGSGAVYSSLVFSMHRIAKTSRRAYIAPWSSRCQLHRLAQTVHKQLVTRLPGPVSKSGCCVEAWPQSLLKAIIPKRINRATHINI